MNNFFTGDANEAIMWITVSIIVVCLICSIKIKETEGDDDGDRH